VYGFASAKSSNAAGTVVYAAGMNGLFKSIDGGASWNEVMIAPTVEQVSCVLSADSTIFVGANGIYRSTDGGANWKLDTSLYVSSFAFDGTYLFAGSGSDFYRSSKGGTTWSHSVLPGFLRSSSTLAVAPNGAGGTYLFAGMFSYGVARSTNQGSSWTPVNTGLTSTFVLTLLAYPDGAGGTNLYAGTGEGAFRSTNSGTTWTKMTNGLPETSIIAFAMTEQASAAPCVFAATPDADIYRSLDNGASWTSIGSTGQDTLFALFASDSSLIAGSWGKISTRSLSQLVTSVGEQSTSSAPTAFSLLQNYPNPFNPSTTINYELPTSSLVTLKVFDLLGREVAILANEEKTAGRYSVRWNAGNMSSGVYFYRLDAGAFSETKKLLLLR